MYILCIKVGPNVLPSSTAAAARRLRALGAIADAAPGTAATANAMTGAVRCTALGFRLAMIPVAPRYARMLLASITASEGLGSEHIVMHACAIIAALSIGNITAWESVVQQE